MKHIRILLCAGFLLGAHASLSAQEDPLRYNPQPGHTPSAHAREDSRRHSLALQWGVYIPSNGGFLNHAAIVSPSLEWEWSVSNAISIGAEVGYTHGAEQDYTRDVYEGDLVTGVSDRSLTLVPFTANIRWTPVRLFRQRLRPFIGIGIGAQYAAFRISGELINDSKVRTWGTVVRPEAGLGFSPRHNGRFSVEARCSWQYAANKFPVMNVQSLSGIRVSVGVRQRF